MAVTIVNTDYGTIRGTEINGYTEFRGVPYAKPPVGELRFRPPVKMDKWDGVRDCTEYGPIAVQTPLDGRHAKEYYYQGFPEMREDCLYINISTAAESAGEKRPVYVWFHGGGLTNCHSHEIQFNNEALVKKGIVVITVGQRLNLFGYLVLPQLDQEQGGKSGNYGFMDQIMALEWIVENIENFGGDPENITLGGQSGGSLKAIMMAACPKCASSVKRVISQSGLKWMIRFKTREEAREVGLTYLRHIGLPEDISPEELRRIPTEEIYSLTANRKQMPGDMVRDDEYVCGDTVAECIEKYVGDVDFLNFSNLGEADVMATSQAQLGEYPVKGYVPAIDSAENFYKHYKNLLGPLYDKYDFENLVPVTDENAWLTAQKLAAWGLTGSEGMNVSRNLMLNRMFGRYMKKKSDTARVYNGLWEYMIPLVGADLGTDRDCNVALAWHSTELWFVFDSLRKGTPPDRPWRDMDFEMAERMSSYWANFMKTGDPNGEGLPYWPEAGETYGYAIVDWEMQGKTGLDGELDRLIHEFIQLEYQLDL